MDLRTAILERISRRSYEAEPASPQTIEQLEAAIWECNRSAGLSLHIITNDPEPFAAAKSYGMLSGASCYIAMVAKKDDEFADEKIGYYGESLVLLATRLGLGTCWIGGTYDADACSARVADDEVLRCVIVFGNVRTKEGIKEKTIRKTIKRKTKEIKDMLNAYDKVPNWVVDGVRYAVKAPSAQNRQPVKFFCDGDAVNARVKGDHEFDLIDLGIAKLHFEVGAGGGTWDLGNGGLFTKNEE